MGAVEGPAGRFWDDQILKSEPVWFYSANQSGGQNRAAVAFTDAADFPPNRITNRITEPKKL